MQDLLEIPVTYENVESTFEAYVTRVGYVNHIIVDVGGTPVTIEMDEEGNYRALVDAEKQNNKIDKGLIGAIVDVLQQL